MIRLFRGASAVPAGRRGRVVLCVEGLERRDNPSTNSPLGPTTITAGDPTTTDGRGSPGTTNSPPQIVNFCASPLGGGSFLITGQVVDEHPGGLTITFGGDVDSMYGRTTTTNSKGSFSLLVCLNTDGTDMGWLTAVTQDNAGQSSNEATVYVDP